MASFTPRVQRSLGEQRRMGKSLRERCPRQSHAQWQPGPDRLDPIHLLETSNAGRIPQLVPVRHGRMLVSPFAFFRGAALNMAADLASTPTTGLRVQACGDCHLSNFGAFATPERRVIFDINDLDDTLPAPWEWDVKRLATSFVLACRNNGLDEECARDAALACVCSYRERMDEFSEMRTLDIWYARIDVESVIETIEDRESRKRIEKRLEKARERTVHEHDFPELATRAGDQYVIKDNPPLIFHPFDLKDEAVSAVVKRAFAQYRETLPEHRRLLLDRFRFVDMALKVVGVGSVGTACCVVLLMAGEDDPLFLQVKEARTSVLEAYAGPSRYANHGQRVVVGSQLMQSASDLFLGWTEGREGQQFYIRQLRDMKIKPVVEVFTAATMIQYANICGWTLARAHARSGDPGVLSGYLGKGDSFDQAIAAFAVAYADQSERDHAALRKAVQTGRLEVAMEQA